MPACRVCFTWFEDPTKADYHCADLRCGQTLWNGMICDRTKTDHEHKDTDCCGKADHRFKAKTQQQKLLKAEDFRIK
jgi:hypothetical protein